MELGRRIGLKLGLSTREAFGRALAELGEEVPNIVVIDGDVNNSTRTEHFAKRFPERFFNFGIAESNMVGVAGGMAACGKIPVVASFACFLMCNAFDQLRMSVAYPRMNVKLVGSHAGISIGQDGPSQMGVEDVALACALGGFVVIVPADEVETREAVRAAIYHNGPVYIRVGRPEVPIVYTDGCNFTIGKANKLRDGRDVTLIANGIMVAAALEAAHLLEQDGISARVLDMHTVKPIDAYAIEEAARDTGAIVVAEEHFAYGGLGSVVAMAAAERYPVPIGFVNLGDTYSRSGDPDDLLRYYGLTADNIAETAKRTIGRKR
ncbi:MAG: transketolase C-terminal domain-containing protein [Armatimonadota bacterium]|nr:transketolase family protein [Armatimonadota bacterium]MCX7777410.1 transketolase family protein [Armatimonadota bacterium]MDW8025079.1 transketolase C-terminal domain-containing protein [Armatimonadota bacterium]